MFVGRSGEEVAARYLCSLGWQVVDRNWRCRWGELDLVAVEPTDSRPVVVFVEVKSRTGTTFGTPLMAVTPTKLQHMRRACAQWLACHPRPDCQVRLDAIGLLKRPGSALVLQHIRGLE
jgi:putative endonuclease